MYDEGKRKEKVEVAKRMLRKDVPIDFVQEVTELSLEEIEEIKKTTIIKEEM